MPKNMASKETNVLKTAMQRPPMPFSNFCKSVVDDATMLVNGTNGRLRFVNYNGDGLVPGAINGALEDHPEIFARDMSQGLVGLAAKKKQVQKCNNVKKKKYFRIFREGVQAKFDDMSRSQEERELLKRYDEEVLEFLESEIAAPIMIGDELLGVLSVHSNVPNAFSKKDSDALDYFASSVAVALLNRRSIIQEELTSIERNMMTAPQIKGVASFIAEGIKKTLEEGIPNIFLCRYNHENPTDTQFEFVTSAGKDDVERQLGNFPPRTNKSGLGMQAITAIEDNKEKEKFIVVPRVQKGPDCHAKKLNIFTTCCIPLSVGHSVVGLLYVHFKDKVHFFTAEEKKALNLFTKSAAIAIKNAITFKTYSEQFGDALWKEIDGIAKLPTIQKADTNWDILSHLQEFSKIIQTTRGDKEISQAILKEVSELCIILKLPKKFSKIFEDFQKSEGILYSLPYYRDHFVHMFHVFILGYIIINRWWHYRVPFLTNDEKDRIIILKTWFLTAIQHDIAYYIEKAGSWVPTLAENLGLKSIAPNGQYDWGSIITSADNILYLEQLSDSFMSPYRNGTSTPKSLFEDEVAFKRWYIQQLLVNHDHAALSGLALLRLQNEDSDEKGVILNAALAVVLHNYCKKEKEEIMGQLAFADYPLACLLAYCDAAQEWGRAKTDKNELRLIDPNVRFKSLQVTPSKAEVVLSYNLEDISKKSGLIVDDERTNILTGLKNGTSCLQAWAGIDENEDEKIGDNCYIFCIRAVDEVSNPTEAELGKNNKIWSIPVACGLKPIHNARQKIPAGQ